MATKSETKNTFSEDQARIEYANALARPKVTRGGKELISHPRYVNPALGGSAGYKYLIVAHTDGTYVLCGHSVLDASVGFESDLLSEATVGMGWVKFLKTVGGRTNGKAVKIRETPDGGLCACVGHYDASAKSFSKVRAILPLKKVAAEVAISAAIAIAALEFQRYRTRAQTNAMLSMLGGAPGTGGPHQATGGLAGLFAYMREQGEV